MVLVQKVLENWSVFWSALKDFKKHLSQTNLFFTDGSAQWHTKSPLQKLRQICGQAGSIRSRQDRQAAILGERLKKKEISRISQTGGEFNKYNSFCNQTLQVQTLCFGECERHCWTLLISAVSWALRSEQEFLQWYF